MRPTKKTIGFFVLEFIVIFVGLSASFIFEEKREDWQREERKEDILSSILASIPRERFNIQFTDSVFNNELRMIDSIAKGLDISERSIADFIKVNVRFNSNITVNNGLADWRLFVNPNDPEMVKIRGIVQNKSLPQMIEIYLSFLEATSIEKNTNLRSELDMSMMMDLYRSWEVTNKLFREEKISTGDMYMGDIELKGDYKSLLKKESFIEKVIEIGIARREMKRTFIAMNYIYLDWIESEIKKELEK